MESSNTTADPNRSYVGIYDMIDFQPDAVASLLQRCCRATIGEAPIGFEYCWSCSNPRVEAFGGGCCVIHPDRVDSGATGEALAANLSILNSCAVSRLRGIPTRTSIIDRDTYHDRRHHAGAAAAPP